MATFRIIPSPKKGLIKNCISVLGLCFLSWMLLASTNIIDQNSDNPLKKSNSLSETLRLKKHFYHGVFFSLEREVYLIFDNEHAVFLFGINRCDNHFAYIKKKNKFYLAWNVKNLACDIHLNLDVNKSIVAPIENQVFAEISPANDSMLYVNYYAKDYFRQVNAQNLNNELGIDTLFPTYFLLRNLK